MTSQIKWRLTATYLIVIFIAMSILGALLSYSVEHQFNSEVRTVLDAHGQVLKNQIETYCSGGAEPGSLDNICRLLSSKINARVTVYGRNREILGDSERNLSDLASSDGMPTSMKVLREGFGCQICHSEVRNPKTMTVSVPIVYGSGQTGSVELSTSLYEAKRAAARTRRIILTTLLLTSLIAAGISMRLAASIAGPISHMNEMARKMASGDLNQQVPVDSKDEVGQLAESLNIMADHLRTNLDQLAQERDKMRTILTSMADGIVVTDRSGMVTLFNRASERLFGLTSPDIIGKQVEVLDSVPEIPEMVRSTLAGKNPVRAELMTKVPAERIVYVYAAPARDQTGSVAGSILVLQDITEARRQAEIRKDFVANASHELRTPVASIRAIVGALQSGAREDPSVAQKFLDSLDAETERLSLLMNDLLNLSELESGKQGPKRSLVYLRDVVDEAVESLAERTKQYGVDISLNVPSDLCAFVNRRQVLQVLQNLVDNAVKYNRDGGSVDIVGKETDAEINITIKDTGVGISPADLDRIFERFYRVDKARSRQLGGTGLGLSIVRDIMDAHGGRVTVESRVGVGSAFTIAFPKIPLEDESQRA